MREGVCSLPFKGRAGAEPSPRTRPAYPAGRCRGRGWARLDGAYRGLSRPARAAGLVALPVPQHAHGRVRPAGLGRRRRGNFPANLSGSRTVRAGSSEGRQPDRGGVVRPYRPWLLRPCLTLESPSWTTAAVPQLTPFADRHIGVAEPADQAVMLEGARLRLPGRADRRGDPRVDPRRTGARPAAGRTEAEVAAELRALAARNTRRRPR